MNAKSSSVTPMFLPGHLSSPAAPGWKRRKCGAVLPTPPGQAAAVRFQLREPPNFGTLCANLLAAARIQGHIPVRALPVSWATLTEIQAWDEDTHQLKLMHWLTSRHFHLSGYDKMNVGLAKAVLQLPTARQLHYLRLWAEHL